MVPGMHFGGLRKKGRAVPLNPPYPPLQIGGKNLAKNKWLGTVTGTGAKNKKVRPKTRGPEGHGHCKQRVKRRLTQTKCGEYRNVKEKESAPTYTGHSTDNGKKKAN